MAKKNHHQLQTVPVFLCAVWCWVFYSLTTVSALAQSQLQYVDQPLAQKNVVTSVRLEAPLGTAQARLLLERTGFSPTESEVAVYQNLSRVEAVERLLEGVKQVAQTALPGWANQAIVRPARGVNDEARKALRELERNQANELRNWWVQEMLSTPSPLQERMTLFWHNHFVSGQQKVRASQLMLKQNQLLRQYAIGSFADLLHAIAKDSAMLIYLDGVSNRQAAPNENFAREVMELFTLGEGNYNEQDVKEAARAFTGWGVHFETGAQQFRPNLHDKASKTVVGRTGNFGLDDVLDVLLQQPATAEWIVTKLWREFISPTPNVGEVKRIAALFRNNGYRIGLALRELFLSPYFFDESNRAALVKSPVDLVVGTARQLGFEFDDALPFTFAISQLGQNLFNPPNVKGWPGGLVWINSQTLLARKSVLERLLRAANRSDVQSMSAASGNSMLQYGARVQFGSAVSRMHFDDERFFAQWKIDPNHELDVLARVRLTQNLLPMDAVSYLNEIKTARPLLRALLLDPVYQLK